jgi:glycine C-acetyltransferase
MNTLKTKLNKTIDDIKKNGLYKSERLITSKQETSISVSDKTNILNFCANNYLGLSNHPDLIKAAKDGIEKFGFGLSSVRFICGTQTIHKELENDISNFLNKEDTILYTSCFDANGGLFETLLTEDDAIISDSLNHASIIDGVRLCKAKRFRYANSNMEELEHLLKKTKKNKNIMITTDGVFSMDGYIAKLDQICMLAKKYNAIVHVDDSHATGFVGKSGQGSAEYHGVLNQVDIITSTFGKALGGASGGFTSASKEIIEILRQRSRPYLFSNSLAPSIVYASIKAIKLIQDSNDLRKKLDINTQYFRKKIQSLGFKIKSGTHPIVPVMIGDAKLSKDLANDLLSQNIYVVGFSFPVVPKGEARIRVQISASHTKNQINQALKAFKKSGEKFSII